MKLIFWLCLGILLGPTFFDLHFPWPLAPLTTALTAVFLLLSGIEIGGYPFFTKSKEFVFLFAGAFAFPFVVGLIFYPESPFIAIALSISALPVAIQILKEKNLYRTALGRQVLQIACACDIAAWIIFSFILPADHAQSWLFGHWPLLTFFLGLLIGKGKNFSQNFWLLQLQNKIVIPLFFIGLGLGVNFRSHFSPFLTLKIFALATITKGVGAYLAARKIGLSSTDAQTLAFLLNARGAMEIFAARYALEVGLISPTLFSALLITAVTTSLLAALKVQRITPA